MKRYVVTGAAGFIGSKLVEALHRRGAAPVIAVDEAAKVDSTNLAGLPIEDFLDKQQFLDRLRAGRLDGMVEAVLHQGACSDTMQTDERYMMENNHRYSLALLEWCQREQVPLLYASSAAVYGGGKEFREDPACEAPLNLYGRSKLLFDQDVRRVIPKRTAQVAGLRYFNVYGPNEGHKGRMASVALHAFQEFTGEGRIRLFVGSGGFPDGAQKRDFIHVDDTVAVNLWLLERKLSGIFNCGTGRAQTFNDVALAVLSTVRGKRIELAQARKEGLIEYIPFPPGLHERYQSFTQADLAQLRKAGYAAPFMSVEQGVAAYVKRLQQPS